ncbi:PHD finger protein 21Aa isoform X2 [Electrophorus electricus]|uniref:PHD finger protein 21Aa isoform X2 n=1 Tax=Electrophorus electricus TaxID=8005 RepID=UPI0015CFAF74|nr:PHD finger protein 21Aa isoform X2 [Electrophorus electricus]
MVFKTADVVKAEGGVGFGQKGLMMELQSLQEALKVEIQIHQKLVAQMKQDPQNAELKMQLHDLQAKITALSERQKKVVEQLRRDLLVKQESSEIRLQTQTQLPLQADGKTTTLVSSQSQTSLPPTHLSTPQNSVSVTPVISTKTLPLMLRAATPTTPIAMMPTPTIAMVTTLTNTPLPSLPNSDPQNLPVSLQTSCKPANQGMEPVRIVPKNTIVVQTATQPIKVPQFVPPTRQTARPASLPQVMPKPPAPVTPAVLQPVLTSPQPLQQPVYLTAKLSSTLLPSSGPVHQLHIFSPQPGPAGTQACPPNPQACLSNTQPGAVVIQPNAGVTQPGPVITQTAMTLSTNISQFSVSSVQHSSSQLPSIHISAQTSKPQPSPASTSTETPHSAQSSDPCPDTSTLSAVGRVEPKTAASSLAALQTPASTSTVPATPTEANTHGPAQSPEPKRQDNPLKLAFMVSLGLVTHDYLEEIQSKRQERKRRTTANPVYSGAVFEPERKKSTVSYLNSANQGCRKRANEDCLSEISKKEEAIDWPGPLAIVHSYISYKAEREQEKQKLEKWSSELRQEREELELRVKQLSDSITICRESRNGVLSRQKEMEASIEKVKGLVRLIRGIQLPCLPLAELPPAIMANGDLDRAATQQPGASSEVNQHPNVKCSLKDSTSVSRLLIVSGTSGNLGESVNLSGCLKDTGAAHTHSSASSPEPAVDATDGKSTSGSHQGSVTNNCAPLSNSHIKSTVVTSSNGALETEEVGHEESINKNNTNDINKNNADINKNIIRDLQGSPEPPLPAVMSLAEVIQGVE